MLAHFVSALTLAAMLLHSILGCCWHHDHGTCGLASVGAGCCGQRANADVMPGAACFGGASEATEGEFPPLSDDPCDHSHGGCTEAACVYVLADNGPVMSHFVWLAALLPLPAVTVDSVSLATTESVADVSSPPSAAQKVRALLQVWTI